MRERPYRRRPFRTTSRAFPRCLDREEGHRARHRHDHRPRPAQGALRTGPQPPLRHRGLLDRLRQEQGLRHRRAPRARVRRGFPAAGRHRLGGQGRARDLRADHARPRPDGTAPAPALRSSADPGRVGRRGRVQPRRRRTDGRFQLGYEACEKLLDEFDPRETDRGRADRHAPRRVRSDCPHGDRP